MSRSEPKSVEEVAEELNALLGGKDLGLPESKSEPESSAPVEIPEIAVELMEPEPLTDLSEGSFGEGANKITLVEAPQRFKAVESAEVTLEADSPVVTVEETSKKEEKKAKPRILVIDGDKDYGRVIDSLLINSGYEVSAASDGEAGIREALGNPPALVLLNFNLPTLSGYDVMLELRRHCETRNVPVVMFSRAAKHRRPADMGIDVAEFVAQPFSPAKLLAAISRTLRDKAAPTPGFPSN